MNIKPPPIDFRSVFTYDHERGLLIRTATGRPAGVQFKRKQRARGAVQTYGFVTHENREYAVHRVVWAVVHGAWPETSLDHIDHDKRNNRIENLRLAPTAVNQQNLSLYRNNTSGRTGIQQLVSGRFQVRVGYKKQRISLGTYDTFEEAEAVHEAVLRALGFHPNHGS
jgi:hypothetical protein